MTFTERYQNRLAKLRVVHERAFLVHAQRVRDIAAVRRFRDKRVRAHLDLKAALLRTQAEKCAICSRPFGPTLKAVLDRSPHSSQIRGSLCIRCNRLVSRFHDDAAQALAYIGKGHIPGDLLWRVARYIRKADKAHGKTSGTDTRAALPDTNPAT